MIEKKTIVTALSGVLVGGLLLSGGLTFASSGSSTTDSLTGKMPFFGQREHRGGMGPGKGFGMAGDFGKAGPKLLAQGTFDQLVKEGVIKQEKADEIKAYLDKKDLFTDLVKNNILTQEQANTIKSKLNELAQKARQQHLKDSLKALVDKGTLTQAQVDKILTKHDNFDKDRDALFDKVKNMTQEERRQYMQDNKVEPQNLIDQLVTDGTITQDQANALANIFPFHHGPGRGRR